MNVDNLTFVLSGIAPLTTLTKSLSRYRGTSSVSRELTAGVDSEGFTTAALPAASAPTCYLIQFDSRKKIKVVSYAPGD